MPLSWCKLLGYGLGLLIAFSACKDSKTLPLPDKQFSLMPSWHTGVAFSNDLKPTESFNMYTYKNFFNGGGVGLGDINNDGLVDVFLCGNMVANRMYLNKGNWQFEDITAKCGLGLEEVWTSGVSMVDVNGDGLLDIYLCKSGKPDGPNRHNELYINKGDLTFEEQGSRWGINDLGLSTHAAFFDYDLDGDLDCYLLNNSLRPVGGYDYVKDQRNLRDTLGGNKLYRNELAQGKSTFTDVSAEAGIYGSSIGFGLGVTIGDINKDHYPDIFVSNDFFERDYLYVNQKDGTFKESAMDAIREMSMGSMGADMADLNNDSYPEIFVTEMLPESDRRIKTKTKFENWDQYQLEINNGYGHQFTRNVLQFNHGNGLFSEIGRYANVFATDWSWGALMFDMDNDGWNDIFVANGIYKDLTDQDYINFYSDPSIIKRMMNKDSKVILQMMDSIPSEALPNYAFHNSGQLTFNNKASEWGLGTPSFSNGSAYGDLDNDGDLDLIVNNVNMEAFVYRNNEEQLDASAWLTLSLTGSQFNRQAIGAQVTAYANGQTFYRELHPMKGFESCIDPKLHFGLGTIQILDSLVVLWPNGSTTVQKQVATRQFLSLSQAESLAGNVVSAPKKGQTTFGESPIQLPFVHKENDFIDFDRDQLLYFGLSRMGPAMAVADVNGDGLDDVFFGGAKDQASTLLLQGRNGQFSASQTDFWITMALSETVDAVFFDADGDTDMDLYIANGGNELPTTSDALKDRLLINDGKGKFSDSGQTLPTGRYESTACIRVGDMDSDGDFDMFVGVRLQPFLYGIPMSGYVLENDGKGKFRNVTNSKAPMLKNIGMITDAQWSDVNKDGQMDLVVVGEYMPITLLTQNKGVFSKTELVDTKGYWNSVLVHEENGVVEIVAGNMGLNSRLKASKEHPIQLYINDFDGNSTVDHLLFAWNGTGSYPVALRSDLVKQMPILKKKYLKFHQYVEQQLSDMFEASTMTKMISHEVQQCASVVARLDGQGQWKCTPLPPAAQWSSINAFLKMADGSLLIAGNKYDIKPELGIQAGSYGYQLERTKEGYQTVTMANSGWIVPGVTQQLSPLRIQGRPYVLVGRNNDAPLLFALQK